MNGFPGIHLLPVAYPLQRHRRFLPQPQRRGRIHLAALAPQLLIGFSNGVLNAKTQGPEGAKRKASTKNEMTAKNAWITKKNTAVPVCALCEGCSVGGKASVLHGRAGSPLPAEVARRRDGGGGRAPPARGGISPVLPVKRVGAC